MRPSSSAFLPDQNSPVNRLSPAASILAPRRALTRSMKAACTSRWIAFDALHVLRLLRQERVERVLVGAGGIDPPLDAHLVDQLMHAEGRRDHADGADDGACVGIDLVAREGQQIAARRRHVFGEDIDLEALLLGQRPDALIDQHRLHGRAAGRIDLDRHGAAPRMEKALPMAEAAVDRVKPGRSGVTTPMGR